MQAVLQGSLDESARASELGAEPARGSRMLAADIAGVDFLAAPSVLSAAPEASGDDGHESRHFVSGHTKAEDAASVRASQQIFVALGASEGGAQTVDARVSTASGTGSRVSQAGTAAARGSMLSAGAVELRHSIVQHSEEFVQGVLQVSLDEATRASELGAEPGRGSRMSAADTAGVDSSIVLPVPLATPEVFVQADRVPQQKVAASRTAAKGAQLADTRRSASPDAVTRVSQLGAGVAQGSTTSPGAVDSWLPAMQHSEEEVSLDQAVRASRLDEVPGHGPQTSATVETDADSLAVPPTYATLLGADWLEEPFDEGSSEDEPLYPGDRVRLCGLVKRPALNGRRGVLTHYHAATSRLQVTLDDDTILLLKHANIIVLEAAPPMSSTAPEAFADAGYGSLCPTDRLAQPQDASSDRVSCPMCKGTGGTIFGPCNVCP